MRREGGGDQSVGKSRLWHFPHYCPSMCQNPPLYQVNPPPPLTQSNSLFLENQIINTTRGTKPNRRWVFQIVFLCQTAFFRCHYFGKAFSLCALEKTLDHSQDTLTWETRGLQTKTIFSEIMTRKNS